MRNTKSDQAAVRDAAYHQRQAITAAFKADQRALDEAAKALAAKAVAFGLPGEHGDRMLAQHDPEVARWQGILRGNGVDIVSDWNYDHDDPDGFDTAMAVFDARQYA